jgi:hypothetical protein
MGIPENLDEFESYIAEDLTFYIHRELWETRDLSKGKLAMHIEGYGRYTLHLTPPR